MKNKKFNAWLNKHGFQKSDLSERTLQDGNRVRALIAFAYADEYVLKSLKKFRVCTIIATFIALIYAVINNIPGSGYFMLGMILFGILFISSMPNTLHTLVRWKFRNAEISSVTDIVAVPSSVPVYTLEGVFGIVRNMELDQAISKEIDAAGVNSIFELQDISDSGAQTIFNLCMQSPLDIKQECSLVEVGNMIYIVPASFIDWAEVADLERLPPLVEYFYKNL